MRNPKVYCCVVFPFQKKGFCLDRQYRYLNDEDWKTVAMGEVVEHSTVFFPFRAPDWAEELEKQHHPHFAVWREVNG